MRAFTKYLLPRYVWFMLWYKQWFKNSQGIKGFAHQVMNSLMQRTMALAEKLKNENKRLEEAIKAKNVQLAKWLTYPTVEADDYDEVRNTVRKLGLWVTICIVVETALNYFGVSAVILQEGWVWVILKVGVAFMITGMGVYIFKKWFGIALNKPMYKQTETQPRNWIEFALLSFLCVGYEALVYYLCRIRGIALEGANGEGFFTYFVVLAGLILPLITGYLAYERSLFVSAYKNTLRIATATKQIAKMESKIATNNQKMGDHFNREVEDSWAFMQEFKVYKENYNLKHSLPEEHVNGHYCETHERFIKEASERYQKQAIHKQEVPPIVVVAEDRMNGQMKLPQKTV